MAAAKRRRAEMESEEGKGPEASAGAGSDHEPITTAAAAAAATAPGSGGVTVFWGSGAPPAWKVTAALVEKRIPHKSELITFESQVLKTPPFVALNPRMMVPILLDGDVKLYESMAILHYLEDMYTEVPLLPKGRAERALALTRAHETPNASSAAGEVVYYLRRTDPDDVDPEYLNAKKGALDKEAALWESYLTGNEFLAGSQFTLADISFFPQLAYCVRLGFVLDGKFPNLSRYYDQLSKRKCFVDTWPPHWKEIEGVPLLR